VQFSCICSVNHRDNCDNYSFYVSMFLNLFNAAIQPRRPTSSPPQDTQVSNFTRDMMSWAGDVKEFFGLFEVLSWSNWNENVTWYPEHQSWFKQDTFWGQSCCGTSVHCCEWCSVGAVWALICSGYGPLSIFTWSITEWCLYVTCTPLRFLPFRIINRF
jgi:hypothetical protein